MSFFARKRKSAEKEALSVAPHLSIGLQGENLASKYLIQHGYVIVTRNWKVQMGEIDIIARKNTCTVCVEVKARQSKKYGYPEEAVTLQKREKLKKLAEIYQKYHDIRQFPRIDVISIEFFGVTEPKITHFQDIGWQ